VGMPLSISGRAETASSSHCCFQLLSQSLSILGGRGFSREEGMGSGPTSETHWSLHQA
jgi:hypothetical protein